MIKNKGKEEKRLVWRQVCRDGAKRMTVFNLLSDAVGNIF